MAGRAALGGEVGLDAAALGQACALRARRPRPRAGTAPCTIVGGPATCAMRVCPRSTRCWTARRCPGASSTPTAGQNASPRAGPDDDGGQAQLGEQRRARVVDVQVGDEDAVDAALVGEPAVGLDARSRARARPAAAARSPRADSSLSSPAMNDGKNGSARSVSGGRAMTRPTANASDTDSARARELGVQPSSRATSRMRSRVVGGDPGPVVEGERDRALRDARSAGDVVDRGAGHTATKPV